MLRPRPTRASATLLAAALLASCGAMRELHDPNHVYHDDDGGGAGAADEDEDGEGASAAELHVAELRLEKARASAEQGQAKAQAAVEVAERELEQAVYALTVFREKTRTIETDEARLKLDRAVGKAADAEAELAELEAMYAAEEFAATTKELVITRGRRNLEHARRDVALQERRLRTLIDDELPEKERAKERTLLEAEAALQTSRLGLVVAELEGRIAVAEAERKLGELREKKDEAEAEG